MYLINILYNIHVCILYIIHTCRYKYHTKTTAAQKEVALNYQGVRGRYFLAVFFAATINYVSDLQDDHFL